MEIPEMPEGAGTIGYILAAGAGVFIWLRKQLGVDKMDRARDEAQINVITTLQKERDAARLGEAEARLREDQAWTARNTDARLIGELTAKVDTLTKINESLTTQVDLLRKDLASTLKFLRKNNVNDAS